jgi:hypothetical protein
METTARTVVFVLGALAVLGTIGSAVRTVVLPRAVPAKLGRFVFVNIRRIYDLRLRRTASYERRDQVMAGFAPSALLALVFVWLAVTLAGYTAMYWALGVGLRTAFTYSGSSILTLGFREPADLPSIFVALTEAAIGLTLLALLITYLPSLYAAFSRREAAVALLEVRAGSPPFGATMIERYARIDWLRGLPGIWERWENWFVELEESHTSFPSLVFFRSPQPDHSWITAAGAVLDAAALSASALATRDRDAQLCLRAGYLALQRIATFFGIPYDPDPSPDDPITVTREEFDAVYDRLASLDIPLQADRDLAWRDFAGWRVNYDVPLVTLCSLVMAPYAPWSSDRSVPRFRVKVLERFRRQRDARASPGP